MHVSALTHDQKAAAAALLARGMLDNPVHVAVFGADPVRRHQGLHRMFETLFRVVGTQQPLGAFDQGTLIGVAGVSPVGTCQPSVTQRLAFLPGLIALGPARARRLSRWLAAWADHDPEEPHVPLGPVAVEPDRQRQGIGHRLLADHCSRLDAAGEIGYLETDKRTNVTFYQRHGYAVVGEAAVLGVPTWFMTRQPQKDEP